MAINFSQVFQEQVLHAIQIFKYSNWWLKTSVNFLSGGSSEALFSPRQLSRASGSFSSPSSSFLQTKLLDWIWSELCSALLKQSEGYSDVSCSHFQLCLARRRGSEKSMANLNQSHNKPSWIINWGQTWLGLFAFCKIIYRIFHFSSASKCLMSSSSLLWAKLKSFCMFSLIPFQ